MKKAFSLLLMSVLVFSILFNLGYVLADSDDENEMEYEEARIGMRERDGEFEIESRIKSSDGVRERIKIRVKNNGDGEFETELGIEEEFDDNNISRLQAKLSNGRNAEVKIMPNVASEVALRQLRLNVCSLDNNCTIELKEVANRTRANESRLAYEIQIERHSRILGIFRAKMEIRAEVDAETGELIDIKKPWWAFLAAEPTETDEVEEVVDEVEEGEGEEEVDNSSIVNESS